MADEEGGGGDAKKDFFTFLFILAVLGFAWYETGGPGRSSSAGLFLNPPPPLGTGGTYGLSFLDNVVVQGGAGYAPSQTYPGTTAEFDAKIRSLMESGNASPYKGQVYFSRNIQGLRGASTAGEYIAVEASSQNGAPVPITGWRLKSAVTDFEARIGNGSPLFYSGRANNEVPIELRPGEQAIISTGRSPAGTSFRVNKCSGYLAQFQTYEPTLQASCPLPHYETTFAKSGQNLDDACTAYLRTLRPCTAPITSSPPSSVNASCAAFIADTLNYNSCIDNHRLDADFYAKREWRVFLGRDSKLWRNERETIQLLDQNGKMVDLYSYRY